jgi:hypothetical protein
MLELAQNWSAINIVQKIFVVLGLVRESSVINKHIVEPPAMLEFVRNPNGRAIPAGSKLNVVPNGEYVDGFKHGFLGHMKTR